MIGFPYGAGTVEYECFQVNTHASLLPALTTWSSLCKKQASAIAEACPLYSFATAVEGQGKRKSLTLLGAKPDPPPPTTREERSLDRYTALIVMISSPLEVGPPFVIPYDFK